MATNADPVPSPAMAKPASAGPITRAELNVAALRDNALGSRAGPTISWTKDWRNGVSIAATVPHSRAKTYTCHSATAALSTSTPIRPDSTSHTALTMMSSSRLSKRSASLPAYRVNSITGVNCNAVTTPSAEAESCETCSTSQSCAVICTHPKMREINCPKANSR